MPTASKKTTKKKLSFIARQKKRVNDFLARRPHRSFRLTPRAEYRRALNLPGYIAFTHEVSKTLWRRRGMFSLLALTYTGVYALLVGIQSQDQYSSLIEMIRTSSQEFFSGSLGSLEEAGVILVTALSFGVSGELTEAQQIFAVMAFLMLWLTTVWLLRNTLAGHKVKLRDGLYNAGAPLFATLLIAVLFAVQLLPVALATLLYSAAESTGVLNGGAATMMFWIAAILLGVLSLYWITSTIIALILITVPGMYPYQAVKMAGDMTVGRRVAFLLRWLWMVLAVAVGGTLIIVPIILLDLGIKHLIPAIDAIPIVPVALLLFMACASIWMASYVYLLYRKVVDYDANQA